MLNHLLLTQRTIVENTALRPCEPSEVILPSEAQSP